MAKYWKICKYWIRHVFQKVLAICMVCNCSDPQVQLRFHPTPFAILEIQQACATGTDIKGMAPGPRTFICLSFLLWVNFQPRGSAAGSSTSNTGCLGHYPGLAALHRHSARCMTGYPTWPWGILQGMGREVLRGSMKRDTVRYLQQCQLRGVHFQWLYPGKRGGRRQSTRPQWFVEMEDRYSVLPHSL